MKRQLHVFETAGSSITQKKWRISYYEYGFL